jgi:hypothetical protein
MGEFNEDASTSHEINLPSPVTARDASSSCANVEPRRRPIFWKTVLWFRALLWTHQKPWRGLRPGFGFVRQEREPGRPAKTRDQGQGERPERADLDPAGGPSMNSSRRTGSENHAGQSGALL